MERLPMCRICLVQNVRMFLVVNKNLQELYEKLTDIPFVTEDSRPILACFICCAKLNQCYRLLRQCLEAEELFAQKLNEDYEPNPLINLDHFEFYSGFNKSPTENISIGDECQIESIAVKDELPAVGERFDDIIEPKEKHQSDELEPEIFYKFVYVVDIPPQLSESYLEDNVPLMKLETEMEEEEVFKKKQVGREKKRTTVVKKPKQDPPRTKLEDTITAEQTKHDKPDSKVIWTTQKRTSEHGTYFKEPYKCEQRILNRVKTKIQLTRTPIGKKSYKCDVCQRSFSQRGNLTYHVRIHTGEKPYNCDLCPRNFKQKCDLTKHYRIHTGEKPYKCDICQRGFRAKDTLTTHIRVHTGEKPYNCDLCQRSFKQKGDLTQHYRIHTGEKPYKCDICQRDFRAKYNLTTHIRVHTGEKPYQCDVCQHSFKLLGQLRKHYCC